jgi:hypothetical protein
MYKNEVYIMCTTHAIYTCHDFMTPFLSLTMRGTTIDLIMHTVTDLTEVQSNCPSKLETKTTVTIADQR